MSVSAARGDLPHYGDRMTQPDVGAGRRLYGMMQDLVARAALRAPPEIPPARSVVALQDALDAVIQVAAMLDEETQAGRIPFERGVHAAAMLMLIRDYIQPLPRGLDADAVTDLVTPDLKEQVAAIREARNETGLHG